MNCGQIQAYLEEFTAGSLPAYKASWVLQHLAGCASCRIEAGCRRWSPAPAAGDTGSMGRTSSGERWEEAPGSRPIQRPVSKAVRIAATLGMAGVLAILPWALLSSDEPSTGTRSFPPGENPAQFWPDARVGHRATTEQKQGITLRLESLTRMHDGLHLRVRFEGTELSPPAPLETWVTLLDGDWHPLQSRLAMAATDETGVTATVYFRLPESQDTFLVHFSEISHRVRPTRTSPLRRPTEGISLEGNDPGPTLIGPWLIEVCMSQDSPSATTRMVPAAHAY